MDDDEGIAPEDVLCVTCSHPIYEHDAEVLYCKVKGCPCLEGHADLDILNSDSEAEK